MTRIRAVTAALLILIVLGLFGYVYVEREMSVYRTPATTDPFVVPPGLSARAVLKILRERGLIADERLTMVYVVLSGNRKALRAGEYLFDKPVTTRGVLDAMVAGAVFLHKFTIPEGLTVAEVGMEWQKQGFGTAEDFAAAAREAGDLVQDIEGNAGSVEGYLFPETYSFAIHTSPRQAIHAMVQRYRAVMTTLESAEEVPRVHIDLAGIYVRVFHSEQAGLVDGVPFVSRHDRAASRRPKHG